MPEIPNAITRRTTSFFEPALDYLVCKLPRWDLGKFRGASRPGNRSPDLRGLYRAGGAAHPGPGMPMVLMSGWIAADTLDRETPAPALQREMEVAG